MRASGDFTDASRDRGTNGRLGSVFIGGSLTGGAGNSSGRVRSNDSIAILFTDDLRLLEVI